jgi:hypothetical protein
LNNTTVNTTRGSDAFFSPKREVLSPIRPLPESNSVPELKESFMSQQRDRDLEEAMMQMIIEDLGNFDVSNQTLLDRVEGIRIPSAAKDKLRSRINQRRPPLNSVFSMDDSLYDGSSEGETPSLNQQLTDAARGRIEKQILSGKLSSAQIQANIEREFLSNEDQVLMQQRLDHMDMPALERPPRAALLGDELKAEVD